MAPFAPHIGLKRERRLCGLAWSPTALSPKLVFDMLCYGNVDRAVVEHHDPDGAGYRAIATRRKQTGHRQRRRLSTADPIRDSRECKAGYQGYPAHESVLAGIG
jgi:hypothetical protein